MNDKVTELSARVERLEARVNNLAELVESVASGYIVPVDWGYAPDTLIDEDYE